MILAIDYGTKYIGIAESDEGETVAQALTTQVVNRGRTPLATVLRFLPGKSYSAIVVGLPLGLEQKPTQISLEIEKFILDLSIKTGLKCIPWNETLTSQLAERGQKGKPSLQSHSEAARIMLQEYLDFKRTGI